jgi:phospholipase C
MRSRERSRARVPFAALTIVAIVLALSLIAPSVNHDSPLPGTTKAGAAAAPTGIHKIKHIIVIMQENRSFDNYFGTFPGADGIPMKNGHPTTCAPDPAAHTCVAPFPVHTDNDAGGPHGDLAHEQSVDGGKMDGFIRAVESARKLCVDPADPICNTAANATVMGYHTQSDIPNYWAYAKWGVLQDRMFASAGSWSLPQHLFLVSGWSAKCKTHKVSTCRSTNIHQGPAPIPEYGDPLHVKINAKSPIYAWTDLTYLLHKHNVSWGYYVVPGAQPDCNDGAAITCAPRPLHPATIGYFNPLPYFDTVRADNQVRNIRPTQTFFAQAKKGTLPAVSWVMPSQDVSEHPPSAVSNGQSYVTSLINAVMRGPDWSSTAIFVAWDDWGGFYDHVKPPVIDSAGYGIRVPGLVISPYAKKGFVDHQTLSFDAYLKFIEDVFLGGQRLDPKTDGRPDPRPTVRESVKKLGTLVKDFNFSQKPRAPKILPLHPKTTLIAIPPYGPNLLKATPGVGQVTLSWVVPNTDGGTAITSYLATPYINDVAQPPVVFPADSPYKYTEVVTGFASGTQVRFTVQAVSALGPGAAPATPVVTVG